MENFCISPVRPCDNYIIPLQCSTFRGFFHGGVKKHTLKRYRKKELTQYKPVYIMYDPSSCGTLLSFIILMISSRVGNSGSEPPFRWHDINAPNQLSFLQQKPHQSNDLQKNTTSCLTVFSLLSCIFSIIIIINFLYCYDKQGSRYWTSTHHKPHFNQCGSVCVYAIDPAFHQEQFVPIYFDMQIHFLTFTQYFSN